MTGFTLTPGELSRADLGGLGAGGGVVTLDPASHAAIDAAHGTVAAIVASEVRV